MAVAILDIDGTLVDTDYHHALAWFRALCEFGLVLAIWRIHRHLGMGGDHMVVALCGDRVERENGDAIRDAEGSRYGELIGEVRTMARSRELISALKERGHTVVVASSAKRDEVEHYVELLDARELVDAWTTSADVESTKPAPDLVHTALERVGGGADQAVMVSATPRGM